MRRIWMPRMENSNLEVFLRAATPCLPWRSAGMVCVCEASPHGSTICAPTEMKLSPTFSSWTGKYSAFTSKRLCPEHFDHAGMLPRRAEQRVAAGQEEQQRRGGGGGVLRPGRPVGALRREQRLRPRRAPRRHQRRQKHRRHAAFRSLPLRRPAVHRRQARHQPRNPQEHGERDGLLERRQLRGRGRRREVRRVLILGRRVLRRRRLFSVRRRRLVVVVEAEGVPEFPVQGVGLALRQIAPVPQGGRAGAGVPVLDVAPERGAVAFQLDVRGMVPYLSHPCPWQPQGGLCVLPNLPFPFISFPR